MPSLKTEITEISTGLGLLGYPDVRQALQARPSQLLNVTSETWDHLDIAYQAGTYVAEFGSAFANGQAFLAAPDGLRGHTPNRVEWKGPQNPPGHDQIPADLRVDHVYLISCKYGSKILFDPSPAHLFERVLAVRRGPVVNWFQEVAASEYQTLWGAIETTLSVPGLPAQATNLDKVSRAILKPLLKGDWPQGVEPLYLSFVRKVAENSAAIWESKLTSRIAKEEMLWRLLRFYGAPYFMLGSRGSKHTRIRIHTPWDWQQVFEFRELEISADQTAGQAKVKWKAVVVERSTGNSITVPGHVEVRWSHGRFQGNPEAKVYLDIEHADVPGYVPI
jgi:hypothetical protein